MLKIILSLLLLLGITTAVAAQDTITKTNGEAIKAKVLEITLGEVKYKKFDNPEGPTYVLAKADVLLIEYENNTSEVFPRESYVAETSTNTQSSSSTNMYVKGQGDALAYYRDYKSAGTGTLVATLLSPIGGLATAFACATTPPKEQNLNYPDQMLMQDFNYSMGYRQRAKQVKSEKVWKNFGIAMGVNVAFILLLVSQYN